MKAPEKIFIYKAWQEPYDREDSPTFLSTEALSKERQKEIAIDLLVERFGYKGLTKEEVIEDWGCCSGCYLVSEEIPYKS